MPSTTLRLFLVLSSFILAQGTSLFDADERRGLLSTEERLFCHVVHSEILAEEGSESEFDSSLLCMTKRPNHGYREAIPLELPIGFILQHSRAIESGKLGLSVSTELLKSDQDNMPTIQVSNQDIEALHVSLLDDEEGHQRRLSKELRTGTRRLLAVRVSSLEGTEAPLETAPQIRDSIFGSEATQNLPTVVSQFAAASHGALRYVASSGSGITDGVAEISISTSIMNGTSSIQGPLMQEILDAAATTLGDLETVADQIIFCLPTGSLLNNKAKWTAFTYLYEPYSFYQKSRCTKLSVPLHEVGHSLGFSHSGKGRDPYGDEQGYMGYAVNKMHGPLKGFNAHKHWMSGWFDDRSVDIESNLLKYGAIGAPLVAFTDASNQDLPESEAVVLKLGHLYAQYNRGKGYNSGTFVDQRDRVTINYAESEDNVSDLVAALGVGETYVHSDFDGDGNDLIVQVCSVGAEALAGIDYAVVSMHLEDGFHTSLCGDSALVSKNWRTVEGPSDSEGPDGVFAPTVATVEEENTVPSVAPSFNEDFLAYEDTPAPTVIEEADQQEPPADEPISDIKDEGITDSDPAEIKDQNRLPSDNNSEKPQNIKDKELEILEEDNSENSEDEEIAQDIHAESGSSIILVVAVAGGLGCALLLGTFMLCRYRKRSTVKHSPGQETPQTIVKKSVKKTEEDLSSTEECSDGADEDEVIEVARVYDHSDDYVDVEDGMF